MSYARNLLSRGEEVVFASRQHWFGIVAQAWLWLIGLIVAVAILIYVATGEPATDDAGRTLGSVLTIAGVVLALVTLGRIGLILWDWQNQEYLITNRRVIKAEGILNKSMADSSLEKINDARLDQSLLGRIFGYGDLDILTAAEDETGGIDDFPMLADPVKFKIAMLNQKEALERPDLAPPRVQHPAAPPPMQRAPLPPRAGSDRLSQVDDDGLPVSAPADRAATTGSGFDSVADTLERLGALRDKGLITADEFEAKKRQLLERM